MIEENAITIADEIILLINSNGGSEYIGEPVTKFEHIIQSAMIAEEMGLSNEIVIAAMLHDIGHIIEEASDSNSMDCFGIRDHETIGAAYLKSKGFSECICQCVQNHVSAKRYLCYLEKSYYNQLSEASKKTLEFQGGIMSESEAIQFQLNPFFKEIIIVRRIDELAKKENLTYPPLKKYRNKIIYHLINKESFE